MPIAGCPSATALATSSSSRAAPSSIENSVWTWRWVNDADVIRGTLTALPVAFHGSLEDPDRVSGERDRAWKHRIAHPR